MPEVTVGGSISYGNIYDFVNFIDEVSDGSKTWLQWESSNRRRQVDLRVTVLQHNDAGEIVEIRIHFLPFPHVARLREGLYNRLAGSPVASHFA
jgi:hypothetical protein